MDGWMDGFGGVLHELRRLPTVRSWAATHGAHSLCAPTEVFSFLWEARRKIFILLMRELKFSPYQNTVMNTGASSIQQHKKGDGCCCVIIWISGTGSIVCCLRCWILSIGSVVGSSWKAKENRLLVG